MTWVDYVDESMRHGVDDPAYVLAAAIISMEAADEVRAKVKNLAVSGARFHWRRESTASQRKAVATVAGIESLHLVVIGTPLDLRRQERGRRKCMERLLFELAEAGVRRVWLESRNALLDARDIKMVDAWRAQGHLGPQIYVDHGRPLDEPLLWLADLVAGVFSTRVSEHRDTLAGALMREVCSVDLK